MPSAVPPCSANGTSLPSRAASVCRSRRGTPSSHRLFIATSTAAASALPPAMPPATGIDFSIVIATSGDRADVLGHQFGGPPGEVAFVGRQRVGALPVISSDSTSAIADRDLVEQRDRVEDGGQFVVAVVAAIADARYRLTLPGTRTVTEPVGTHSDAVLPSDTARD